MAKLPAEIPAEKLPVHIGFIMDGNGRWAAKRGLPRSAGHRKGAEVFGKIAQYCREIGIPHITVYAFSTENWKRPADEVEALMELLRRYLSETFRHREENARVRFLGERAQLSADILQMIEKVERESENNTAININVALNYGGRSEILQAVRRLAADCVAGTLHPDRIDEALLSHAMYTAGQPDPDLIIRPSGEMRTSNFLLWQSAYAELLFMDVLWPDFTPADLNRALVDYVNRDRRFGGI